MLKHILLTSQRQLDDLISRSEYLESAYSQYLPPVPDEYWRYEDEN